MRDQIVQALVTADQLAFAVPGVSRAGLNLAARARRAP
jgi:hypothetical protein